MVNIFRLLLDYFSFILFKKNINNKLRFSDILSCKFWGIKIILQHIIKSLIKCIHYLCMVLNWNLIFTNNIKQMDFRAMKQRSKLTRFILIRRCRRAKERANRYLWIFLYVCLYKRQIQWKIVIFSRRYSDDI